MVWGFESPPAHQLFNPRVRDQHVRPSRNPREARAPHHADAGCHHHPVRGGVAPEAPGPHGQGRRFPPGQGADERGRAALRLLGALRGDERQGRPGVQRSRQRGQAARGRRAAHHREGRRPGGPGRLRRHLRGLPGGQAGRPVGRRGRARLHRGDRRRDRQDAGHPAQAAPHLPAARRRRRRRRGRPRDDRLRRQDRRRALRRRQGRGLPVHHRRRPDARAVRRRGARHEGRREQDLPAAVPGRLPRQGRGRQGGRLPGHAEEDRGAAPARGQRGAGQVAGHQGRHRRRRCAPTSSATSSAR